MDLRELVKEILRDIMDVVKQYGKTSVYIEVYRKYDSVEGFVKPREKSLTIYVSKYCAHCREFLRSPGFALLVDKAREKGYRVVVSHLNSEKEIEKAISYGLTSIPVVIVKREDGKEETVSVDKVLEVI